GEATEATFKTGLTSSNEFEIKILDCPGVRGLLDQTQLLSKCDMCMSKFAKTFPQGVHGVVMVIKFGNRFFEEDELALTLLTRMFGEEFLQKHGVCVVSNGDVFRRVMGQSYKPRSLDEWCRGQTGVLGRIFKTFDYRCALLDNTTQDIEEKKAQVQQVVERTCVKWLQVGSSMSVSPQLRAMVDIHMILEVATTTQEYHKQLKFTIEYTQTFDVTRTSVLIVGETKTRTFGFDQFKKHEELASALMGVEFLGPCRGTDTSLEIARRDSFSPATGMRTGVKQLACVITEGRAVDEKKMIQEADTLKKTG
ncbi:unnamed protein product, partial [Lymnaea stagnalis]